HRFAEIAAKAKYKEGKRPVFLIHVILNPIFKFLRKYFLQLGFLDGYYGFVFCSTTAGLNFYKYLRLHEYWRKGLPDQLTKQMKVSVIISTYNAPAWLEKVLWAYCFQDYNNFEIIVADDGSGIETKQLIERFRKDTSLTIKHVWHEDRGYRRQTILNKAIKESDSEYLIFTDGDCIPRKDFIATHIKHAEKGYFLSGGYCKLPMETSKAISLKE